MQGQEKLPVCVPRETISRNHNKTKALLPGTPWFRSALGAADPGVRLSPPGTCPPMPAAGAASASNPRCGAHCLAYILGYHPLDRDGFPCCLAGRRLPLSCLGAPPGGSPWSAPLPAVDFRICQTHLFLSPPSKYTERSKSRFCGGRRLLGTGWQARNLSRGRG